MRTEGFAKDAARQRLPVTVNGYLGSGGDNFTASRQGGQNAQTGMMYVDAPERYFREADTVTPALAERIQRLN